MGMAQTWLCSQGWSENDLVTSVMAEVIQALSSRVIMRSAKTRWHSCCQRATRYPSLLVADPPNAGSCPSGEFFWNRSLDASTTPWNIYTTATILTTLKESRVCRWETHTKIDVHGNLELDPPMGVRSLEVGHDQH